MATQTALARPAHTQALRTRRDGPRPSLAKRPSGIDTTGEQPAKKRKMNEPYVLTSQYILQKFRSRPPSLIIHLHDNYFRFDGQDGSFALDSPMKSVLTHLRWETVPHEMMEELLAENVPFYDGCLIVEVHNHRSVNGKEKSRRDSSQGGDAVKFSMHNCDGFITPSPMVPYPKRAKIEETAEKKGKAGSGDKIKVEKLKDAQSKQGPKIVTLVLQPTPLSRRQEMLILSRTPASDMKKRKSSDGSTPSAGQPQTPQLTVPSTPLGPPVRSPSAQGNRMCLESSDMYNFERDVLLMTSMPLYLEPVSNPQEAQKVLDMLQHPLHSEPPPSPKTRKRTTAEMEADDAQAAEAERRMLIMDERIASRVGAGPTSNENQGAAASFVHSRFKTIQMVKEKHEEQERLKKEEEDRAALERRQQDEINAAAQAQQARMMQASQKQQQQQQAMAAARARQQAQEVQLRAQAAQQSAQMANPNHPHSQQNSMMQSQAHTNFPHPTSMSQTSPVVRQQTPMMNSSPMIPQIGFPMTATSSQQGAGSPSRPTSAAMPAQSLAMARQISQQQHQSRNNTPQIPQSTPNMAGQAVPNRQMSQTPRGGHGSPAPGTPVSATIPKLPIQAPGQSQMSPEQMAMLQQAAQLHNQHRTGIHVNSPGQHSMPAMGPEQILNIRQQQQQQLRNHVMLQQAQAQGGQQYTPQQVQAAVQQQQALLRQRAMIQQQQQQQQQMLQQQQQQQQNAGAGQAGSPGIGIQTPQMNHAQIQQANGSNLNVELQRQHQMAAVAQLKMLGQQYGNVLNIPQEVVMRMPATMQQLIIRHRQQQQQQQQQQSASIAAQQLARRAQAAQLSGQTTVGSTDTNPGYMHQLRAQQAAMLQGMQGMQGLQNMQGMQGMQGMNMNGMQDFSGQGQGDDLTSQFAAMQNALGR